MCSLRKHPFLLRSSPLGTFREEVFHYFESVNNTETISSVNDFSSRQKYFKASPASKMSSSRFGALPYFCQATKSLAN